VLPKQLRGDLDDIVLRCLRKVPSERYASVEQLEADLGNYLDGLPVQARGGHGWYRLRKFVGRNRIPVGIATAAIFGLIVASGVLFRKNVELQRERDRAQYALDFMKDAFTAANPARMGGADVSARQILEAQSARMEEIVDTQPALYASLAATVIDVETAMSMAPQAAALAGKAVAAAKRGGVDKVKLQHLLVQQAEALALSNKESDAVKCIAEAETLSSEPPVDLQLTKARLQILSDKAAEAVPLLEKLVEQLDPLGPTNELALSARWRLADAYRKLGRSDQSFAVVERTLAWQKRELADGHPRVVQTRQRRLASLLDLGRYDEALVEANLVAAEVERSFGAESAMAASAHGFIGSVLFAKARYVESIEPLRRAVDAWRRSMGNGHSGTLKTQFNLAGALRMVPGHLEEADQNYRDVTETATRSLGARNHLSFYFRDSYGEFLIAQDRPGDAIDVLADEHGMEGLQMPDDRNHDEYVELMRKALANGACRGVSSNGSSPSPHADACRRAMQWLEAPVVSK
jgi:serine/threonine-protein kinase